LGSVVVLGGDEVVGQTLELLLRSADYDVRFLTASSFNGLERLDGVGLVLIYPGLSAGHRETLLALVEDVPVAIPILEPVRNPERVRTRSRHLLSWTCRAEELKRQINAILLAESGPSRESYPITSSYGKGEGA
jgi:hypothetical protein